MHGSSSWISLIFRPYRFIRIADSPAVSLTFESFSQEITVATRYEYYELRMPRYGNKCDERRGCKTARRDNRAKAMRQRPSPYKPYGSRCVQLPHDDTQNDKMYFLTAGHLVVGYVDDNALVNPLFGAHKIMQLRVWAPLTIATPNSEPSS